MSFPTFKEITGGKDAGKKSAMDYMRLYLQSPITVTRSHDYIGFVELLNY